MTVQTDLDTTFTEKEQREDAFAGRAALENATNVIEETHQTIKALVDSGNFNTIPTDLKQALNQWWTIIKIARTSIGSNSDIMEVFNWRPTQ